MIPGMYSPAAFPSRLRAAPAKNRTLSMDPARSKSRAIRRVLPVLRASSSASSAPCSSMRSAIRSRTAARSAGSARDHEPSANARRAAMTARSTSTGPPSGTRAMGRDVAGSTTSIHRPDAAPADAPSIHIGLSATLASVSVMVSLSVLRVPVSLPRPRARRGRPVMAARKWPGVDAGPLARVRDPGRRGARGGRAYGAVWKTSLPSIAGETVPLPLM